MGLFGNGKKKREEEYLAGLDIPACLNQEFEMEIENVFTIIGRGTVVAGVILSGVISVGEHVLVKTCKGDDLETTITLIDIHTKERRPNGWAYRSEHVGLALRGLSEEQLTKGDRIVIKR